MKLDKKAVKYMFFGCSDKRKGFYVWNFKSQKSEITRSAQFEELAETKHVQVVIGDKACGQNRTDCQWDELTEQVPIRTNPHFKGMDVDLTEDPATANEDFALTNRSNQEQRSLNCYQAPPNVHMNSAEDDLNTIQVIVPKGRLDDFESYPVSGKPQISHNVFLALPPSNSSQALVPVESSTSIVSVTISDTLNRLSKRYRIQFAQADAAIEAPSSYREALESPQS
uniref:AlNc14C346G10858 protein n=1 Tax=Albugo laibachii Nc14 TaxID=890382 RepID=F0WXA5_9STRA|nr:AlNc14C346G10858 [Albugo laibachii Nc14]|eukprot:CCA26097.1 AlNc14C346G10858 [Albugo laibachii Nc14]